MSTEKLPTPRTDEATREIVMSKFVSIEKCLEAREKALRECAKELERENEAMRAAIEEAYGVLKSVPAEYDPRFFRAGKWSESALAALKPFLRSA